MKKTILAARRQQAIEAIGNALDVPFGDIRKGDSEHRQLFILERIAGALGSARGKQETAVSIDDILAIDGLSQKSRKAIELQFKA